MDEAPLYDENLWFYQEGCDGKHFLIGNPHTVSGRMWAWCPKDQRSFFVSLSGMDEMSEQTRYWVKGYLAGNQPEPPRNDVGDLDFESAEYKEWRRKIEEFERTGKWE